MKEIKEDMMEVAPGKEIAGSGTASHEGMEPEKSVGVKGMGVHSGVKLSDLAARREEIEGKLFWDIIRLFRGWAQINLNRRGVDLPTLDSLKKAIVLGQAFEWKRTGGLYKLVIARDHLRCSEDHYDKVEFIVFVYAEVNFPKNNENGMNWIAMRKKTEEFSLMVDNLLTEKGVGEALKAYDFRRGGDS